MYDKTEELKRVLELDKDTIQTKLKEEKLRLDEETKRENEKQKRIFYILISIFILLAALFITIFTFTKDDSDDSSKKITENSKKELKVEKDIKQKIEKPVIKVEKKEEPETKEIIKIVEKEVIVTKEIPMPKEKMIELLKGNEYNIAKCYDYSNTTLKPTNSCKEILSKFFEENKDAIRFEVIGVIGEDDIKKADTMAEDKKIKEYIIRGVARDRVIEAAWLIKEVHKSKTLITAVNYYITSKKNNKGIVVRAYH